jgi:uncharacterized protein YicC (UPF0701 family)
MSATDTPEIPDYADDDDREEVLSDLEDAMAEALRKFTDGRVRDAENEKVRQGWLRAYTGAVKEYRRLVADLEEAEQEQRIERLESLVDELAE